MSAALAPLCVAIPLIAASLLVATAGVTPRIVLDGACTSVAVAVVVMCALLLARTSADGAPLVTWLGGWEPRDGLVIGVDLAIDRLGASLALFVALLFLAAFAFAWRYFTVAGPLFHALLLLFLAGCMGFAMSGDLFNLFVFLELLTVSAFALTAYDAEEEGPLQGALTFGVTISIGAVLVLTGVSLLYARTGSLNMSAVGEALTASPVGADGLVVCAFALIVAGLLVKTAVVPFHFWLADAYSVAPTPVCLLLSAAVSELGLYALARVYWTVFSGVIPPSGALQAVFVTLGVITALVGATMALAQRHLKRLLAFTTISHVGLYLIGFGLLSAEALAGTAVYVFADGLGKAALFVAVGLLQHRWATVDELSLHGRGRAMPITGAVWVLGVVAVVGLPPFGGFLGKSMIGGAAADAGMPWLVLVFVLCTAQTTGAAVRAFGRIFLGRGEAEEADDIGSLKGDEADAELGSRRDRVPPVVAAVALVLALAAVATPLIPGLAAEARAGATSMLDRTGTAAVVLQGASPRAARVDAAAAHGPVLKDWIAGALTVVLAVGIGVAGLERGRLRDQVPGAAGRWFRRALRGLRLLHSGRVGDYVLWLVVGLLAIAGALGLAV